MRLRNVNLEEEDYDSLFIPRKQNKIKKMKQSSKSTKSERTNKTTSKED